MNDISCKSCKFFESENGFCRRYPATPLVIKNKLKNKFVVEGMFPVISKPEKDWCGEHEPINNEILKG